MSEFSQALATEETFAWQGQTYKLAGLVMEVVGQWESWLKERAWRELESARRWTSAETFGRALRALQEGLAAGDYDFFGEASARAQQSWDGKVFLAWARTAFNHPDFKLATMREIYEQDLDKFLELQRKMGEQDADPNPAPPRTAGAPGAGTSAVSAPPSPASPGATGPGKSAA